MLDECYRRMFSHRHGISLVVLYAIGVVADVLLRWGIWQIIRLIGFDVSEWFPDAWLSWLLDFSFGILLLFFLRVFFLSDGLRHPIVLASLFTDIFDEQRPVSTSWIRYS